jgi:ribonuclease HI
MKFEIYCDGSTRGNGYENSVGAWAWLVHEGGNVIRTGCEAEKDTTNQRMELTAAAEALEYVMHEVACPFDKVVVYTDSAYLHNCYTQKWYRNWEANGWKNAKKQPVANQDLWERLVKYVEYPEVEFVKVKGHAGNHYNEIVDTMAQNASLAAKEANESSNN